MVPPPDPAGDEFPDFENMSLEEQMAWLESLAKRQGASEDEFLTSADLDIPIPEDVIIDEPGYVPYSMSDGAPASGFDAQEESEEEDEPEPEGVFDEEDQPLTEVVPDPMQWLDTLSVQTGESAALGASDELEPEEFGLAEDTLEEPRLLIDETEDELAFLEDSPEFNLEPELGWDGPVDAEADAESVVSWTDLEPSQEYDFGSLLGDEPDIEGDLELAVSESIEEADLATWLTETVPHEEAEPSEQVPPPDHESEQTAAPTVDELDDDEGQWAVESDLEYHDQPESAAQVGLTDDLLVDDSIEMLAGADPMAWLETLAKRQGVNLEELTTSADLDIPELPEDTVVDEPGYMEYSPFGLLPHDEPEEADLRSVLGEGEDQRPGWGESEALSDLDMVDESLAWLSELVTEPDVDVATILTVEGGAVEPKSMTYGPEAGPAGDDALAGMSDEEIAYAQSHGMLTGEQELAWLKRQAALLAGARQAEESRAEGSAELEPAEAAELPAWLAEMRDEPVLEEVSGVEEAEAEALWEVSPFEEAALDDISILESELEAFLGGDLSSDELDNLAEALDEEYERQRSGDEGEPAWYAEAVSQMATQTAGIIDQAVNAAEAGNLLEAVPVDMPDWLQETVEEPADEDMPAWLTEPVETEGVAVAADLPDWLAETGEEAVSGEFEWVGEVPQPDLAGREEWVAREEEASPEAVIASTAVFPEEESFTVLTQRLDDDPNDFVNRLQLARALYSRHELITSMDQYEVLIDGSQLLEDVSKDLNGLAEQHPQTPRVRRLLGDAYVRQGKLQEALDSYRGALEQL